MNISMRYFSILVVVIFSIFSFKYGFWSEASEASDSKIDTRAVSVLKGTITHVRDGDTFEINGIPVRISALDCAENSTPEGKKITRFAKKFLGKQAVCELTGAKTYDRVVGYCSIEGKDFARTMMNETSCKLWAKYDVWDRY
jgi:endonuclease YncB( thermonuclease family)